MPKLTKSVVDRVKSETGQLFLWDDDLPGFGMRVLPSGRRSFIVQYRTLDGRQRRRVLGTFPVMTVDQARRLARQWLVNAQRGEDPAEAIDKSRRAATVADLCRRYLDHHAQHHLKPKTANEDRRLIERLIVPALGNRKAVTVSHHDVDQLHRNLKAAPYQANRAVGLLSTIYNQAELELRKVRPDWANPCRKVKRYKEDKRRRYLSAAELARLGQTLAAAELEGLAEPESIAAIRLLIFTGCRRGEILSLQWDQVDMQSRRLRLSDSKTGAKDVHLAPPAVEVLQGLRPRDKGTHMQDLKGAWQRIRDRAELPDVRLHDLRHSFASVGAGAGLSLPIIGALLGHSQPATTARYAHLASDPLQEAADLVGSRLEDALKGGGAAGGDVVKLPRNRNR
jgi:integrase